MIEVSIYNLLLNFFTWYTGTWSKEHSLGGPARLVRGPCFILERFVAQMVWLY